MTVQSQGILRLPLNIVCIERLYSTAGFMIMSHVIDFILIF